MSHSWLVNMCETGATICSTISRSLRRLLCKCSKRQWMKIFVLRSNIWSESCHWVMSQIIESCHIWMSHVTWRSLRIAQIFGDWVMWHVYATVRASLHFWTMSCHWVMSRLSESSCKWMSHVTCGWRYSRVVASFKVSRESCHILIRHVTYEWVMSYMTESCYKWLSHVTYEWVVSHMNESRHICMSSDTYEWSCVYSTSCHSWMSLVTHEWVMSHTTGAPHCCGAVGPATTWRLKLNVVSSWPNAAGKPTMSDGLCCSVLQCVAVCCSVLNANDERWSVMTPIKESCHILMSHDTYQWVMSHVNESCHMSMGHVTCQCVMWHVSQSCHTWIRRVANQ